MLTAQEIATLLTVSPNKPLSENVLYKLQAKGLVKFRPYGLTIGSPGEWVLTEDGKDLVHEIINITGDKVL